jgi:hypothetical protein
MRITMLKAVQSFGRIRKFSNRIIPIIVRRIIIQKDNRYRMIESILKTCSMI